MQVAVSALIGALAGLVDHVLLLRLITLNRSRRAEPLSGITAAFSVRYLINALVLVLIALATRNAFCILAGALGITLTIRAATLIFYARTGGMLK